MRRSLAISLAAVSILSALGCFSSHGPDDEVDSGIDHRPCAPNCPALDWVTIPGGTFLMGSPEGVGEASEHPQHEVTLQGFQMLKTEVTVSQYAQCVDAGVCSEPGGNTHSGLNWERSAPKPGRENHPVNGVDWYQAKEFSEWVGARLPSEAEWEYAARSAGHDIVYPWGNREVTCEYAVVCDPARGFGCGTLGTMEVCSRPLGNTTQGLCDVAGNVWEWVEDDYHNSYANAPSDGGAWIDSPRSYARVLRGDSWIGVDPLLCRSAFRGSHSAGDRYDPFGFRISRDLGAGSK